MHSKESRLAQDLWYVSLATGRRPSVVPDRTVFVWDRGSPLAGLTVYDLQWGMAPHFGEGEPCQEDVR